MRQKAPFEMTTDELVARLEELSRQAHTEAQVVALAKALQDRKDQQAACEACRKQ